MGCKMSQLANTSRYLIDILIYRDYRDISRYIAIYRKIYIFRLKPNPSNIEIVSKLISRYSIISWYRPSLLPNLCVKSLINTYTFCPQQDCLTLYRSWLQSNLALACFFDTTSTAGGSIRQQSAAGSGSSALFFNLDPAIVLKPVNKGACNVSRNTGLTPTLTL